MGELEDIVRAAKKFEQRSSFLATVVQTTGSAYRRAGARMLVSDGEVVAGCVSGGCLERDLERRGWWLTRGGATVVRYDSVDDELVESAGTGCGGTVDILLERIANESCSSLRAFETCIVRDRPCAIVSVFQSSTTTATIGDRFIVDSDARVETTASPELRPALFQLAVDAFKTQRRAEIVSLDGGVSVLVEFVRPPPHLFVYGVGRDVSPVVTLAKSTGFCVSIVDAASRDHTRLRFAEADRIIGKHDAVALARADRPLALVMSHQYERDKAALGALLDSPAMYIGVLGPRARTLRMLQELALAGHGLPGLERIHAPVGLSLGAETPEQIASSIVAEVQAVVAGRRGECLRGAGVARDELVPGRSTTSGHAAQ